MPSYLIVGLPKSGTSAMYAAVKQARDDLLCIYEVSNERQFDYLVERSRHQPTLAKILLPQLYVMGRERRLADFSSRVMTVRDPRDVAVSWLLYRPFLNDNFHNEALMRDFLAALRRKEADPRSVSFRELLGVFDAHGVYRTRRHNYVNWFLKQANLAGLYPDMTVVHYEQFVDGRLDHVSSILGVDLVNQARLGAYNQHNERAKAHGQWRHWFTPADIDYFRHLFDPYLMMWQYDHYDWDLAEQPRIDPATASEHVVRHAARLDGRPPSNGRLREPEAYTTDYVAVLQSAVEDGREPSMVELALAHRDGVGAVVRDHAAMRELLEETAQRGNALGQVHLALALRHGVGGPADEERARTLTPLAAASLGNTRVKRMIREHAPGWQAVTPVA